MNDPLALTPDEIRELGRTAVEEVAAYFEGLRERSIIQPTTSQAIRQLLEEPLPVSGTAFAEILEVYRNTILEFSRHNGHPRFFGYVASPGTAINAIGSLLADTLNANLTAWRSCPAGVDLEHLTIDWLKQILGYPAKATGLFVSGGSMANFAGLAAARSAKAEGSVVHQGMAGQRRMRVYVSEESHFSIAKAAGMLGIGEDNVRAVPTDAAFRMDLDALRRAVTDDLQAGHLPICVVANAGSTATGAFDPIRELSKFAREHKLWLHVDAAYGGFAALAPSTRPLFQDIDEADSVALDPHKWLYLPMGSGCILYKDPATARAAFSHGAEYTRPIGVERDEAFAFWDYGPELSRPFRALHVWLLLKFVGVQRLGEAIEENIACARYFEKLVNGSPDFEMLAPVALSVFCFRYRPPNSTDDLDALNEKILVALQRAGRSYLSNAQLRGKFVLRGCVLNYRTTREDMEALLDDVRAAAKSVKD